MRIKEDGDSYDIMIDNPSTEMIYDIPINYLRPENILSSGKSVEASNAKQLLKGRKFKVPTY